MPRPLHGGGIINGVVDLINGAVVLITGDFVLTDGAVD
jgi:hypothetical protein